MSIEKEELVVDGSKVTIDPKNLNFNETNLTEYITKEGGYYDNFGGYLSRAEKLLQIAELRAEETYSDRFATFKDNGGSDKLCEARAKSDAEYIKAKERVVDAKYLVNRLKNHLRAWDKNHDNAQSLGHFLRKEMDKLNSDIRGGNYYDGYGTHTDFEQEVDKVVKHVDSEEGN